jgi:4-amino-4-deoxy-L-arabinose transferase-like glycosyltransferase
MIYRNRDTLTLEFNPEIGSIFTAVVNFFRSISDYIVLILASLISYFGWTYYYQNGLTLSYNDAMSHLDIARRVVEGLQPGFAQLGSVWLPMPHILMLPFVWNDFLWHSGLAGSIVSAIAFIGSTFLLYKFVHLLTKDRFAGFIAGMIFAINPNMTYMQSIPMTESILIFFFILSTYTFFLWYKTDKISFIALSALATFLGTLTRYDGWALFGQMVVVLAIVAFRKGGWKKMEGNVLLFSTLAMYGILLWFLWNLLIFNDPLYFATGPFSAHSQQLVFENEGRLFTKGNLPYSIFIYIITIIRNNGALLGFASLLGYGAYLFRNKLNSESLVMSLWLSPLFFNVAALFFGHSIINVPDQPPHTLFNIRYGLMMLPAIAVFAAYLTRKQLTSKLLIIGLLIIQTYTIYTATGIITVKDGIAGASAQSMSQTGRWLGGNAKDGLILIAASSQDSLIFQSGFPMKRFIHEGTGEYWHETLDNPTKYAKWVTMHHGDLVYRKMHDNEYFLNNYARVYDGHFTDIYRYVGQRALPLTKAELP